MIAVMPVCLTDWYGNQAVLLKFFFNDPSGTDPQ